MRLRRMVRVTRIPPKAEKSPALCEVLTTIPAPTKDRRVGLYARRKIIMSKSPFAFAPFGSEPQGRRQGSELVLRLCSAP